MKCEKCNSSDVIVDSVRDVAWCPECKYVEPVNYGWKFGKEKNDF